MKKKIFAYVFWIVMAILVFFGISAMMINDKVVHGESHKVISCKDGSLSKDEIERLKSINPQCAIVFGAGLTDKDTPSPMLKERLDIGILLYKKNIVPKILLTGDNGSLEHNELHAMLKYTLEAGVKKEDIFCDHAGFNTWASVSRAMKIFKVERAIFVTQSYHQYRALYLGEKMGLESLGVGADQSTFKNQWIREIREILARDKDFLKIRYGKDDSLGGDIIDISGDGRVSQGE